jgi:hypothetical protein
MSPEPERQMYQRAYEALEARAGEKDD